MKSLMNLNPLLVLAPHTDDAELGCGGTMSRFIAAGLEVHVAAFSTAEESLPRTSQPGALKQEFFAAMDSMGIPKDHCYIYDYPVRVLSYHRQEVLDNLIKLKKNIQPASVFLPAGADLHQDHQVLHVEGLRAFKDITLWGYELPWNHVTFSANAFVALEKSHIESKWKALQAYRTQLELERPYFSWEFIESLARIRGTQVKEKYAEAFEVVRVKI